MNKLTFQNIMIAGSFFVGAAIWTFAREFPAEVAFSTYIFGLTLGYIARRIEKHLGIDQPQSSVVH